MAQASAMVVASVCALPTAAHAQAVRDHDIPAGPLANGLNRLANTAGIRLFYDSALTNGLSTPGLRGRFGGAEALSKLLTGTGLTFRQTGPDAYTIERAPEAAGSAIQLGPVRVEGAGTTAATVPAQAETGNLPPPMAGGQIARGARFGILGNRDIMDTPFNLLGYTAKKIQDQNALLISDVLIDHPSVQIMGSRSGQNVDLYTIRGFFSSGVTYAGLSRVIGSDNVMAEMAERIEVLTGPSVMLNGLLGVGGSVNVVPKRAGDERLARFTATYGSSANVGGHIDIGQRFGDEKQFGVRFNGVYRDGETAVDDVEDRRGLAVAALDYRGESLRLSADLGYQKQDLRGVIPQIFNGAGIPVIAAPDADRNPGQPWGFKKNEDWFAILRAEYDITTDITAFVAWGYHDWDRLFLDPGNQTITAANGNSTARARLTDFGERTHSADAGVRGTLVTGSIEHEFTVSGSYNEVESLSGVSNGPTYATNIYNPATIARPNLARPGRPKSVQTLESIVVADTISFLERRIQLTLGAREQRVKLATYDLATGARTSGYNERKLSPSVALVVKPASNVSLYGNIIQGLDIGEVVAPTFANAGAIFPPYKTTQYELGVKVDWGNWVTTASLFQIAQPSVLTDVATNSRVLDGKQRNRGLELNILGEPIEGFRLIGGAMFIDAELTRTQGGLANGFTAPNTPRYQFRLSGEWDPAFLSGLTLTARLLHSGKQYLDTLTPRRSISDWTRIDLGARYSFEDADSPTGKPIVLRLNVENVAGRDYWMAPFKVASPRTFLLSASFDF